MFSSGRRSRLCHSAQTLRGLLFANKPVASQCKEGRTVQGLSTLLGIIGHKPPVALQDGESDRRIYNKLHSSRHKTPSSLTLPLVINTSGWPRWSYLTKLLVSSKPCATVVFHGPPKKPRSLLGCDNVVHIEPLGREMGILTRPQSGHRTNLAAETSSILFVGERPAYLAVICSPRPVFHHHALKEL